MELVIEFFYKRKSEEDKKKQIASIPSQDKACRSLIPNFPEIKPEYEFEETQSASVVGREKFQTMVDLIDEAFAKGYTSIIYTWMLNRLARNGEDGGKIIYRVQKIGLKIITPDKTYGENDIPTLYAEFAESNQKSITISKESRRGTRDKIDLGDAPILAPDGYLNDKFTEQGLKRILVDEKRFPLVRQMWELLLTGKHTPMEIRNIANNKWGYVQRNGYPLGKSKMYRMFRDVFYRGDFLYAGEVYEGRHKAMVTPAEFERAQLILNMNGHPNKYVHSFSYTGMKCKCGSGITAYEQYRKHCVICKTRWNVRGNPNCPKCEKPTKGKVYYFCHYQCGKKKGPSCKEPSINLASLEKQIYALLDEITIPEDFANWALEKLRDSNEEIKVKNQAIQTSLEMKYHASVKRYTNLTDKYLSEANEDGQLITDEEYSTDKVRLKKQNQELQNIMRIKDQPMDSFYDNITRAFNFSRHAKEWFDNGSKEDKRAIFFALGSNITISNRLVRLDLLKPFEHIKNGYKMYEKGLRVGLTQKQPQKHPSHDVMGG